ncbi:hypothetical protein DL1_17250 [Thioclava dalianensis]|uniref:Putative DNA-binding domain-containing protein n=1 Tax=Thioclava dalianensis TaxID=1185766 RepID=A0A074TF04_9RHOB|nr:putative DNA-binding domain-containing protein [Thioclava dalianensis]KEP70306.1 hypothetical protein DL1_17250 [Thioclava dalianensis]SFN33824.1 hypothetical protein SAMN05216224_104195 [Thioclava dalianensis]
MPSHREFAQAFQSALRDTALPPGAHTQAPEELTRRFNVYRNNVAHGLAQALQRHYPAVTRLLGEECFSGVAHLYIERHPPRTPILTEWGVEFPNFLGGIETFSHLSYLPDVARIEWARSRAYHAADLVPVESSQLTQIAETSYLRLHPSVQTLWAATPAGSLWISQQPGAAAPPAAEDWTSEVVLVARQGLFDVITTVIPPATARLIEALLSDTPLGAACAAAGSDLDLTQALTLLIRYDLITAISQGRPE